MKYLRWLLFFLSFSAFGGPAPTPVCDVRFVEGVNIRTCVFPGDREQNPDIIYFFHGAGGDEHQWDNQQNSFNGNRLYELWAQRSRKLPTVASVSMLSPQVPGNFWVVSNLPAPGSKLSYRELFEKDVLSFVEQRWPLGKKGRRILLGASMGGYNAYALWLSSPHLYAKAAALCAGVSSLSPYASDADLDDYLKNSNRGYWFGRGPVDLDTLKLYRQIWSPFFLGSADVWKKNRLESLILDSGNYRATSLHAVFNLRDAFGFGPENQAFADKLRKAGMSISTETNQKGHCEGIFTPKLADFLVQ